MTAAEDETDLSKVGMRMDYYEALVDGYLSTTISFLTDVERCDIHSRQCR